jgi:hypothetical protein
MSKIIYIADHHTGGLGTDYYAKTQHLTWQQVNEAHRSRWNFKSSLDLFGGYNFYIEANGNWKQFRAIGEETAAQLYFNLNTISFCMAGNFVKRIGKRIEEPTPAQLKTRKMLIDKIINKDFSGIAVAPNTEIDVSVRSIHPHFFFQKSTECNCFEDGWGQELMKEIVPEVSTKKAALVAIVDSIMVLLQKLRVELTLLSAQRKVGRVDRSCEGVIHFSQNNE